MYRCLSQRETNAARLFCALVLCAAVAGCAKPVDQYSGTLQSESASVGSTIGGRIVAIYVQDGQAVHAHDVLLRFDDAAQRAELAQARGQYHRAQATVADLVAGARSQDLARASAEAAQSRAQLRGARADEIDAVHDAARQEALYQTGDVSQQTRDAARARRARAEANVVALQHAAQAQEAAYASLEAGSRPDQIAAARADVKSAQATIASAQTSLREGAVRAPADGVVNDFDLHRGDLVAAGIPVATIQESGNPYVRVFVPQRALGTRRAGTAAVVYSDADPGHRYDGRIEFIDSRAQFTPQNVQTAEDRAQLSFGVKVRIMDPQHRLHPGTTVEVTFP